MCLRVECVCAVPRSFSACSSAERVLGASVSAWRAREAEEQGRRIT